MSRIFISYKRVDKDKVFKIKEQIESALGEKCWIDLDGIESDAQFASVIINAIDNSDIVLFMHSQAHTLITDFENDWTVRELNYAKEENKRIVFINIDNTPLTKWFKFMFPQKQQVDGTSKENMDRLCLDLRCWFSVDDVLESERQETKMVDNSTQEDCGIPCSMLIPIIQNTKFGFFNIKTKQLQIACEYDNVGGFNNGLCWVIKNNKMGFINSNGAIVIPIEYDYYAQNFYKGYVTIRKEGKWGVLDNYGRIVLPFIHDDIRYFNGEIAIVKINNKWGIIKNDMSVFVEYDYDNIHSFNNELAAIEKNNKYGFINKNGNIVIPFIYDDVDTFHNENNKIIAIVKSAGKYGLIDNHNNVIIPFEYDFLYDISEGIIPAKKHGKCGYLDIKGNLLVDFVFDEAGTFYNKLAIVKINGKYGMIDESGSIVVPIIYDKIYSPDDSCDLFAVANRGKGGFIDKKGKPIIPFIYDDVQEFNDGYAAVCKDNKWGFINTQGKLIIPFKYDDAPYLFEKGKVGVEINGKLGYVDSFANDTFH